MSDVAAYIRVSTKDQKLAGQKQEVQKYLDAQGFKGARWFSDKATGTNTERPGFKKLQAEIGSRRIKTVVVW